MSTPATGIEPDRPDTMVDADAKASAAFDEALSRPEPETPTSPESPSVEVKPEPAAEQTTGSTPATVEAAVSTTTQDAPEWNNLVAKYNGDRNAAAKAYWETNNRNAQLAKEREELAQKYEALQKQLAETKAGSTPAADTKAAPEAPPELRYFDNRILDVETRFKKEQEKASQFTNVKGQLETEIRTLRNQAKSGDLSLDHDAINQRLLKALEDYDSVNFALEQLDEKLRGYDAAWRDLQEQRSMANRTLELQRTILEAREAEAREKDQREIGQISNQWFGAIDKVATDRNVVPEHLEADFRDYVEAKGYAEVDRTGKPIPDFNVYVQNAAKAYMAAVEKHANKKFEGYSKGKVADASVSAPTGELATAETAPRKGWTLEQWDEYNEKHPLPGLGG